MDLDTPYIDLNVVDTKLDAPQCNVDAHVVTDGNS